ncbi:hypothetical protein RvY_09983 [Ramazzottius varieornatus]|uniref:Mitochondrial inner membrane protease subunit 2 n=1 Tax=Ramazzottius varieornatus TaxID=947166 RepID=A0A1D1VBA3_RAMVA|nr:hypothetical protein RvY_09983 [Ramazzottius varieornatus]
MLHAVWNACKFVGVAIPVSITFLDNVGSVARVHGSSMWPTLNGERSNSPDYVWLNSFATRNFTVERGDIIAFTSPTDPNRVLIKRVVGLEGDIVQSSSTRYSNLRIRQGFVWMEGDNKDKSMDSNTFGPVPRGLVLGKASLIIWPPARFRRLKTEADRSYPSVLVENGFATTKNQPAFTSPKISPTSPSDVPTGVFASDDSADGIKT